MVNLERLSALRAATPRVADRLVCDKLPIEQTGWVGIAVERPYVPKSSHLSDHSG
jgi:hypothetical protein